MSISNTPKENIVSLEVSQVNKCGKVEGRGQGKVGKVSVGKGYGFPEKQLQFSEAWGSVAQGTWASVLSTVSSIPLIFSVSPDTSEHLQA